MPCAPNMISSGSRPEPPSTPMRKRRTVRSTVWLLAPKGGGRAATGTGSLIDAVHKLVITNYHVVGESTDIIAVFDEGGQAEEMRRPAA